MYILNPTRSSVLNSKWIRLICVDDDNVSFESHDGEMTNRVTYADHDEAQAAMSMLTGAMKEQRSWFELPPKGFTKKIKTAEEISNEAVVDVEAIVLREQGILSVRAANILGRAGLTLRTVSEMEEYAIRKIRNVGPHSLVEIINVCHKYGLKMKWERDGGKE